jgi:7,8-dihydropterin-6-yl-methyl-4-(beta-D-ribofuranosyl)aminobenzene 5'-phosphate synthase
MTISVLTDNHAGIATMAEHGLSYLIEFDDRTILFDTGQSDMFLKNALQMKINLEDIDAIVLSHGHFDHGNGLEYLHGGHLFCHPDCFSRRFGKPDNTYIGIKYTREKLAEKFRLTTSKEPYKISEKIYFQGEIPRLTDFESHSTSFIFEDGTPDFVMDDSSLVLLLSEGMFIVTGCSHSGIVNTIENAKKITGMKNVFGVLGGFHLKEANSQLNETIRYLRENNVKNIFPSHCTELPALSYFHANFGIRQIKTGDILNF